MKLKKIIGTIIFILIISIILIYRNEFIKLYIGLLHLYDENVKIENKNAYYRNNDYKYVQNTDDFTPESKQDILNIYYTVVNSGLDEFTFYCNINKYPDCISDVKYIASNQLTLSHINNYVHPFNSFSNIETTYDSLGNINLKINKNYGINKIEKIKAKVAEIKSAIITSNMSDEEKIKAIHDYIINHSKYDNNRSDNNIIKYDSDSAYGPLIEGYGLCGGYSDAMMIFLIDFGINNYKIASDNHVWNFVYVNNNWYHLDLTWDDPITTDGSNILEYNFFLITTDELSSLNDAQHIFDKSIYIQ